MSSNYENIFNLYEERVKKLGYLSDKGQRNVLGYLYESALEWGFFERNKKKIVYAVLSDFKVPKGIYIYGGVGRGKTFLMDVFFDFIPFKKKIRVHFYEFMKKIHTQMNILKKTDEPLLKISKDLSKKYNLICFDEFHVSDIADAMILEKLLKYLNKNNVSFVLTSNYHPYDLYPDGLNRDSFIPAIKLISEIMEIVKIPNGLDHRRDRSDKSFNELSKNHNINSYYQFPLSNDSTLSLQRHFNRLSNAPPQSQDKITISGRKISIVAIADRVIWATFDSLCTSYRSQEEYLLLSDLFDVFILSDIPKLKPENAAAARRFMWLVDILYDRKILLIVSADASPEMLYSNGAFAKEFKRTASRLFEMQSSKYFNKKIFRR